MVLTTKTVYKVFFTARINPSAAIRIKYRLAGLFREKITRKVLVERLSRKRSAP